MNDLDYYHLLSTLELSSVKCYRILFLLHIGSYTQVQMSSLLNVSKQNINRYIKELLNLQLIVVDRVEGRNKFFKLNDKLPDYYTS